MYILKGFMVVQALSDNNPTQTSPIGELSTYSKTFSRDIGHYSRPESPQVDLMSFHSVTDGEATVVPSAVSNTLLQIGEWLATQSLSGQLNGNRSGFVSNFLSQFSGVLRDLVAGEMVSTNNGISFLPEFLQFELNGLGYDNYIRIWFSDDAFRRQYDEYHIRFVQPIDFLNDFFKSPDELMDILKDYNDSVRQFRIQEAHENNPSTMVRTDMYTWYHPHYPGAAIPVPLTVIIYGPYGNNIDLIRSNIVDFLLANSDHDRDGWALHFPDLFKRTEYIITPLWDRYSIPNQTVQRGLFSPSVSYKTMLDIAKLSAPEYSEEHIVEHLNSSVANWRSLAFLAIGGPENRDSIHDYHGRFPDYINIPTTDAEFSRMSPLTQDWVMLLTDMLIISESLTEYSDIPMRFTKLERDGILYLVTTFNDVQYLVVSKQSYDELLEDDD